MIQLFNNAVRDTSPSFQSTILGMFLFFFKPVTSLLHSCFITKHHILIQNKRQERQKNSSAWVAAALFIKEVHLSHFPLCVLARVAPMYNSRSHCGSRMGSPDWLRPIMIHQAWLRTGLLFLRPSNCADYTQNQGSVRNMGEIAAEEAITTVYPTSVS